MTRYVVDKKSLLRRKEKKILNVKWMFPKLNITHRGWLDSMKKILENQLTNIHELYNNIYIYITYIFVSFSLHNFF